MDIEALTNSLLNIEQEHATASILRRIVSGLAAEPGIALARVWVKRPGELCQDCGDTNDCGNRRECLHLVASRGRSMVQPDADWSRTEGEFRSVPVGVRRLGLIAARPDGLLIGDLTADLQWVSDPDWVRTERVVSLAAVPLSCRGQVLGLVAVFSREPISAADFHWFRQFADHAAIALFNAQAFEQIEEVRQDLVRENTYLRAEIREAQEFGEMVGQSPAIQKVFRQIELVAPTDATVMIRGESGTGKELVARAIHERSKRADKPLVKVNCGAIPKELFESEFFGHVKGAFTGAIQDRVGRFQLADKGTLFLDEVGEIPYELQSKLLRVLQEGQFERVGEDLTRQVNVRIVAATNRDLAHGASFRQDLFYRLSVFPLEVPPLRERKEDIPALAEYFVAQACRRLNCPPVQLTQHDVIQMQNCDWPGNIRELQNVIERAVITARHGRLLLDLEHNRPAGAAAVTGATAAEDTSYLTQAQLDDLERQNLLKVLRLTAWKVSGRHGAAALLGVKPTTLFSRIQKMGLRQE